MVVSVGQPVPMYPLHLLMLNPTKTDVGRPLGRHVGHISKGHAEADLQRIRSRASMRGLLLLFFLLLSGCGREQLIDIQVGPASARVELASTADARRQGLMGRRSLGRDQGMLLVFPYEKTVQIWMLNMEMPIDVGFFDRHGRLLDWSSMQPDGGNRIYGSPAPALYTLEMNRGWFKRHGLQTGAQLRLPEPMVDE